MRLVRWAAVSLGVSMMALVYAVAVTFFLSRPVGAQGTHGMTCGRYDAIASRLLLEFGEVPLVRGLDWRGSLAEWWVNAETGTWSLVTMTPDGYSCVPAHGEMHEAVAPVARGTDG
jgi:hypothetical protein